ncbi:MAG: hydrogen peroxide-dependent heme synthase [Chthoniobacterales bacterium]
MTLQEKQSDPSTLLPKEGRHVIHTFYRIDHGQWALLGEAERRKAKTRLSQLVQEARALPGTQLLTFSMVSAKADLGIMLLTPDLHDADRISKQFALSLGPDILDPIYSWLSMTERSEYTMSDEEFGKTLEVEEKLKPGTPEFDARVVAFRERMDKYLKDRLEPNMPDWPVFCFYPMSKRRAPGQNWYALDFETRKQLMAGHARVGRTYAGRVRQLITGSAGLDDQEWGVTLFSHTTTDIKEIVYEMRFDKVSADYAEFGEFFIGIQLPLDVLFDRLEL